MSDGLVTVEFYADATHDNMIGAVYLEQKRLMESVEHVGRAICKARRLTAVECEILDEPGNPVDQVTVYRGRG